MDEQSFCSESVGKGYFRNWVDRQLDLLYFYNDVETTGNLENEMWCDILSESFNSSGEC